MLPSKSRGLSRKGSHWLSGVVTIAALGAALGATACAVSSSSDPAPDSAEATAVESSTVSAALERADEPTETTLATLRMSPSHIVLFIESSDGDLTAVEHLNAESDQGQPTLAAFDTSGSTLARMYQHLAPTAAVPVALLEADARALARLPAEPDPAPPADAFTIADSQYPAPQQINWDWNADANWFAHTFYTGGNDGYFAANSTHISQTKIRWTTWYKSVAFNQSFEGSAWFRVKRSYTCNVAGTCSSTKLSVPVPSRGVVVYVGTGNRWRQSWMDGSGVNPRVALAVRWVLNNSQPPPAPPSGCGGHNQLVCFTGAHCKPGLREYNGGCFACGTDGQSCCKDWGPVPTSGGPNGFCVEGICRSPGGNCQL